MKISWILIIGFWCFASCTPDRLEQALQFAGENRGELQKVLRHYEGDTLKLRAARFLIENMTHRYAYQQGGDMDSVKRVRTYTNSFGQLDEEYIRRWGGFTYRHLPKVYDAHVITADYLIRNIDHAFDMWRERPWNRSLSFDDFCEYLLPYRIGDEPLEEWRELYEADFRHLLDSVYTGSDVIEAVNEVSRYLLKPVFIYCQGFDLPHIGARYLFEHRYGTCVDAADIMIYAFRSIGIPCVEDTDARGGHVWVAIRDTTGRDEHLWYINGEVVRGSRDTGGHKRGKVFRPTYGLQHEKAKLYTDRRHDMPPLFCHPYIKDVSSQYYQDTLCADVCIPDGRSCYLSYFHGLRWWACAHVRPENGKITVPHLESELIYLPQHYEGGSYRPADYPIWFSEGKARVLCPDTVNRQRVRLYRKYPVHGWLKRYIKHITGSRFEGSLTCDFRHAQTLYAVADTPRIAYNRIDLSPKQVCRYVRLKAPAEKCLEIAEVSVYSGGKKIEPVALWGSEPEQGNRIVSRGNVADNDPLTYFVSQEKGGVIVLDLGRSLPVDRIDFMPRNDDNFIRPGDSYELLYHAGTDGWKSIYRGVADTTYLELDVPSDALLWLRDHTRGKEEHVFFMDGKRQRFPVF